MTEKLSRSPQHLRGAFSAVSTATMARAVACFSIFEIFYKIDILLQSSDFKNSAKNELQFWWIPEFFNLFSIFVSNVSLFTFIGTIIMGLIKFDIIFIIMSVSIVMITMHLLYDSVRRRYDILSKKNQNFNKIKPVLDYSVMALILFKIIN